MMIDKEVRDQIKQIIFKHLSPKEYKVFLYGSRATGKAWKWSDYDVGIMELSKPEKLLADLKRATQRLKEAVEELMEKARAESGAFLLTSGFLRKSWYD